MKLFDARAYSVSDFAEWDSTGLLELSPQFQRRAVWSTKAKSYLIDTILRGKPMPKVLIMQELKDGRNLRVVVDGQQRLRAILEFLRDDFTVLKTHNSELAGILYSQLPEDVRNEFWQYEIGVDVLFNTELSELLDIFARLNTYSVKLNSIELLNAQYLGEFKTAAHELGHQYAELLLESKILTSGKIARMGEVELTADLLGALLEGISPKKSIPSFYKKYDDESEKVSEAVKRFKEVMEMLLKIYSPEDLSQTNFRRVHLFYSLFLAVANLLHGIPEIPEIEHRGRDASLSPSRIRVRLDDISASFEEYTSRGADMNATPQDYRRFIIGSQRATTDESTRLERSKFILRKLLES